MARYKPTPKDLERWKPVQQRLSEIQYDLANNVDWASHPEVDLPVEAEIQLHYEKKKLKLIKALREKILKLDAKQRKDLKKVM